MKKYSNTLITLTIILTLILSIIITLNVIIAKGQGNEVWVYHDIQKIYDHGSYATEEDVVYHDDILVGYHARSFYIRSGTVEVDNPIVSMTRGQAPDEKFYTKWDPDATETHVSGDVYYSWSFTDSIPPEGQAAVWVWTDLPATFQPEFDFRRSVDPLIIEPPSGTQTVTIEFTPVPYSINFINVHISVGVHPTSNANPEVDVGSASEPYLIHEEVDGVEWQIPAGEITPGDTFVFTFDINVEIDPSLEEPIYYKPGLGVGANIELKHGTEADVESVLTGDNIIANEVIFSGDDDGSNLDWVKIKQKEHSVSFPYISTTLPIYEGTFDIWYSSEGSEKIVDSEWKVSLKNDKTKFDAEYTELNIQPPAIPGTYDYMEIEMEADTVIPTENGYILRGISQWSKNGAPFVELDTEIVINEEFLEQQFWMQVYFDGSPVGWMTGSFVPQ